MDFKSFSDAIFGTDEDAAKSSFINPLLQFPHDINSNQKSWISFSPYNISRTNDAAAANADSPGAKLERSKETQKNNPLVIYLYHPEQMVSNSAVNYEEQEAGWLDDIIKAYDSITADGKLTTSDLTSVKTAGSSIVRRAGLSGIQAAKYDKSKGRISNPNLEVFFKGINYREFSFSFVFSPKSKDEVDSMIAIVRAFKKYSLPAYYGTSYMAYPPTWKIEAKSKGKTINHFKKSVVTSVAVDSSPNQVWATFNDGNPVTLKLDINFKETELISQQDYVSGAAKNEGWY